MKKLIGVVLFFLALCVGITQAQTLPTVKAVMVVGPKTTSASKDAFVEATIVALRMGYKMEDLGGGVPNPATPGFPALKLETGYIISTSTPGFFLWNGAPSPSAPFAGEQGRQVYVFTHVKEHADFIDAPRTNIQQLSALITSSDNVLNTNYTGGVVNYSVGTPGFTASGARVTSGSGAVNLPEFIIGYAVPSYGVNPTNLASARAYIEGIANLRVRGVVSLNGPFGTVTDSHSLYSRPPNVISNGNVFAVTGGFSGVGYTVQQSTDLTTWTTYGIKQTGQSWLDSESFGQKRFFRLSINDTILP